MKNFCKRGKSKSLLTVSALAMALASGFAQADPVVTWNYTTDTTFSNALFNNGGGGGVTSETPYRLTWGESGGSYTAGTQSALTIGTGSVDPLRDNGGPATGSINTTIGGIPNIFLGQIKNGTSITHWNNPLETNLATLSSARITDTLTLTPTLPAYYSANVDAPTLTFDFFFLETLNFPASGFCADGLPTPAGGCPDLFGFNGVTLNNAFQYIDSGLNGTLGDGDDFMRTYFASVFVLNDQGGAFPIQQLVAGECAAIGLAPGCFGFRTAEGTETTAQFAFAVTTEPIRIPEPASLALFGIGLFGLAALRRRQQRNRI